MLTVSPHEKLRRSGARFGVFPILDELKRQDMKEKGIYITTVPFECGFIHLTEPSKFGEDKYSLEMIFDTEDPGVKKIRNAVADVGKAAGVQEGWNPIKPAFGWDSEKQEKVSRSGFVAITGKLNKTYLETKFQLIGVEEEDLELSDLRRGDIARAQIGVVSYDLGANKGVTIYLNRVQKISGNDSFESFGPLPNNDGQQGEDLSW
jgi:hypothetical protein